MKTIIHFVFAKENKALNSRGKGIYVVRFLVHRLKNVRTTLKYNQELTKVLLLKGKCFGCN